MTRAVPAVAALLLTVIAGAVILAPYTEYQDILDQGDRGRDLYCSKKTLDGCMVYRDYWWIYGPVMPYYYSFFYRALGVSVRSVLIGQCLLLLLCGVLVHLTTAIFAPPAFACIAAIAFWIYYPDFPHTYMYTGGITCILLAVYFLFRYLRRPRPLSLLLSTGAVVLLSAVKLNIGVSVFCALLIACAGADVLREGLGRRRERFRLYLGLAALFGTALIIVYLPFTWGLPEIVKTQSFPFSNAQRSSAPPLLPRMRDLAAVVGEQLALDWRHPLLLVLGLACLARVLCLLWRNGPLPAPRPELGAAMLALLLLSLLSVHEYFMNTFSIYYQLHWAFPTLYLFFVLAVWAGTRGLGAAARCGVAALVLVCAATSYARTARHIRQCRVPAQYLDFPRGGVYLNPANNPPEWLATVRGAVDFLMRNVGKDEKIVALPYDTLYCFLSERDSAIRQQEIFSLSHPTEAQEREIIASMERQNVRWAVLSNIYRTLEPGKGAGLGLVCCRLLSGYLEEHFRIAAVFGPWGANPEEWIVGHGVAILRKREAPGRERLFWQGSAKRVTTQ